MKRDCSEFAIPQFWVQSLIYVIIQLNIEYFAVVIYSTIVESWCNVLSTLFPCVRRSISYLADMRFLSLRGYIFKLETVKRNNRIILIYAIAFALDLCCILVKNKESGLDIFYFLFSVLISIFFLIYFYLFYF